MKRALIVEIICFLFILLFVYAALMKLLDVEKFTVQLGQSPLLMAFAPVVAWVVPLVELIIAIMLIFQRTRLLGLIASFTIMVMFTMYIIIILTFASHVPCSCGGILEDMTWGQHLVFNIVFVVSAAVGAALLQKQNRRDAQVNNMFNYV